MTVSSLFDRDVLSHAKLGLLLFRLHVIAALPADLAHCHFLVSLTRLSLVDHGFLSATLREIRASLSFVRHLSLLRCWVGAESASKSLGRFVLHPISVFVSALESSSALGSRSHPTVGQMNVRLRNI